MTPEERSGQVWDILSGTSPDKHHGDWIAEAIRAAVAEEREACAKIAEEEYKNNCGYARGLPVIHETIRARSRG